MTNHGTAVNLYLISKMWGSRDDIPSIKKMLEESFPTDRKYHVFGRSARPLTFDEYVNLKRAQIASIMGYRQYL